MNIFYELILLIDIATAIMLYGPESQVALVGNPAAISCGSDDIESISHWYFLGFKAKDELIYNTKYTKPGFNVIITEQRIHTLKIENVTSDDAGIYRCLLRKVERGGTRTVAEYKADLIVFESHPVCALKKSVESSEIVAGDMVVLFCSVVYYGNWVPVMEWSRNDGKSTETEIIKTPNDKIITTTAMILAEPEDNGVTFSCTMTFQSSVLSSNISRPPNYDLIWNYTLNVFYMVRNLEIKPKSATYSPNDHLYCLADGNPTPSCRWTDVETSKILSHHCLLVIDANITRDFLHTFQCRAENIVAKVSTSNVTSITFTIAAFATESSLFAKYSWLFAAVVTAVVSISIFFTANAIRKSRCSLANRDNSVKSRETSSPQHDCDNVNETTPQPSAIVVEYVQEQQEQELQNIATELRPPSLEVITAVTEESHEGDYSNLMGREAFQIPSSAYTTLIAAKSSHSSASKDNEEMREMPHAYYNIQTDL